MTGTAAELLALIGAGVDHSKDKDWPKNARALTATLRRRAPSLRRIGWTVDDLGKQGKQNAVKFLLNPPPAGERQASDSTRKASDNTRDARQTNPATTRENAKDGDEASDASDRYPEFLPATLSKERRDSDTPHIRESLDSSLATLADMARNNGKPCDHWTDGNYCGEANTRRYMSGWYCINHPPAVIRRALDRPEATA